MIVAMAVHDTIENDRTKLTKKTIESLLMQLYMSRDYFSYQVFVHIIDNGSCEDTKEVLKRMHEFSKDIHVGFNIITLPENIGTAKAINKAWKLRSPGEPCLKMDNDVIVEDSYYNWLDTLHKVVMREPSIGIAGLKRQDCLESPDRVDWFKSELGFLKRLPGEPWVPIEYVNHVMGTCQLYSGPLLDKIGYLYQLNGLYGFDDSLASLRAHVAGFKTVFVPHIEIHHIDHGGTEYTKWKQDYAGSKMGEYNRVANEIRSSGNVYYPAE